MEWPEQYTQSTNELKQESFDVNLLPKQEAYELSVTHDNRYH